MVATNHHPSSQDIKVAVDAAIFTVRDGELCVLTIQMRKQPFEGRWALPGGLLGDDETTEVAARRILQSETGLTDVYLEQLSVFDDPTRDPFGRVLSVAFFALIPSEGLTLTTSPKYADVRWSPVEGLRGLAYDHDDILAAAVAGLRARLGYSNVAWSVLPELFTVAQLQTVYDAILGVKNDKRNFRKKMLATGLLEATGERRGGAAHRPAELYRFTRHSRIKQAA